MAEIESLTTDAIIALINNGTWPPTFTPVVGALTVSGNTLVVNVENATNVAVGLKNTGTAADAAGIVQFEASVDSTTGTDGNWVSIQMGRSADNTIETSHSAGGLAAGTAQTYGWEASVAAYRFFRIRMSTSATASAIESWTVSAAAEGSDPIPSIPLHAVTISGTPAVTATGTVTANPGTASSYMLTSAATINAAIVKAGAGNLYEISVFNPTAAIIYVKLYNKATLVAPATDAALLEIVFAVAINGTVALNFGSLGKRFAAGIGIAIVANPANTDATAIAVGAIISASYV